jgi:L-ascorbate metabolism protein UlaG (beta-lactamase superfamily)
MKCVKYPDYTQFFKKPSNSPKDSLEFIWLGQAGFAFRFNEISLIIDPYLSDYLSKKYKGKIFPHTRLMDIPIQPDAIYNLDLLLSTHSHSDHMDPETLPSLTRVNPSTKIIVPAPAVNQAISRGVPPGRIVSAFSEKSIKISETVEIIPIPAAHEVLKTDENGNHLYLGYIFKFGQLNAFHSGDCVPYDGLIELLTKYRVQVAFLPINGRDEHRQTHNIAGNFHISEVIEICKLVKISHLVVHHFGMFAYNTVTDEQLEDVRKISDSNLQIIIPEIFYKYEL